MQTPSRCAWLLAAGITACLTLHAQENKLTIGASLPLSGSQAEAGKVKRGAIKLG
mgnify:CR=1 FL=1